MNVYVLTKGAYADTIIMAVTASEERAEAWTRSGDSISSFECRDYEEFDLENASPEGWTDWWDRVGSGIRPRDDEDHEQFARRMTALAWAVAGMWAKWPEETADAQ